MQIYQKFISDLEINIPAMKEKNINKFQSKHSEDNIALIEYYLLAGTINPIIYAVTGCEDSTPYAGNICKNLGYTPWNNRTTDEKIESLRSMLVSTRLEYFSLLEAIKVLTDKIDTLNKNIEEENNIQVFLCEYDEDDDDEDDELFDDNGYWI